MTSSAVSAIDYGAQNFAAANLPASFQSLQKVRRGSLLPRVAGWRPRVWGGGGPAAHAFARLLFLSPQFLSLNNAACWVSYQCYPPPWLVSGWIASATAAHPNLTILTRTVVSAAKTGKDGALESVTVITRTPVNASEEWAVNLSQDIGDWYSHQDSPRFTKAVTQVCASAICDCKTVRVWACVCV